MLNGRRQFEFSNIIYDIVAMWDIKPQEYESVCDDLCDIICAVFDDLEMEAQNVR